jgi:hypothetical protein
MPIPNNTIGTDKDVYFTERFKTLVRSEKELLVRTASSTSLLEQHVLWAYRNDFYRLLRYYGIPSHLWWVTAYINGIENPMQDISKMVAFLRPDESTLSNAIARSNTVQG